MKLYTKRLDSVSETAQVDTIALSFDLRQKSRFRATLTTGEDIGVDLPRTGILRGGSYIATAQGEILRVDAQAERLMCVQAQDTFTLLKAAYHLGNRHVPLMLTTNALYFEPDHVLAEMLLGLGLYVDEVLHPFEPESGAYAQHQHEQRLSPIQSIYAHAHS